jgi:hypothetical protein
MSTSYRVSNRTCTPDGKSELTIGATCCSTKPVSEHRPTVAHPTKIKKCHLTRSLNRSLNRSPSPQSPPVSAACPPTSSRPPPRCSSPCQRNQCPDAEWPSSTCCVSGQTAGCQRGTSTQPLHSINAGVNKTYRTSELEMNERILADCRVPAKTGMCPLHSSNADVNKSDIED